MMAEATDAGTAWENPLIPNARLRQMYGAMVRLRMLACALPAKGREGLGMEACLVSTSLDLGPGDVVSDALAGGVVEFLRGKRLGAVLRPGNKKAKRGAGCGLGAECGASARLPDGMGVAERMWTALGAAATLKAAGAQAKIDAKAAGEMAKDARMAVVYARPGEVPTAVWRKVLVFAAEKELPVIFVVLPIGSGGNGRARGVTGLALACHVPAIPVDADDAVAIYRVAQESIGRARIGGGPVLVECVPFVAQGPGEKAPATDGIAGLERYLLQRKVATKVWMEREAKAFARQVAREKASK
jgi:TPP-dependent pyruvate/acetoin dehydrogenase alpha subunit